MEKTSINFTIKKIMQKVEKGNIKFDCNGVQRKENQWDLDKKSLLIHSILNNYPIPAIYTYTDDEGNYQVLDGKQRLTIIQSYIKNEFALSEIPEVIIDGEEFEISGLKFKELPQELQDEINDFSLLMYIFTDCSEEEVSEIFFRLNNGESLNAMQQTRSKLGTDLISFVDNTLKLPFFKEKANFTKFQIKKSQDETCLLQTLMLLKEYPYKKFGANDILKFVESYRDTCTKSELEEYKNLFVKLNEAFDKKHKLLKKIHIPMFVMALKTSEEMDIPFNKFKEWINDFVSSYDSKSEYGKLCSGNTSNREKVIKRLELINDNLINYVTEEE